MGLDILPFKTHLQKTGRLNYQKGTGTAGVQRWFNGCVVVFCGWMLLAWKERNEPSLSSTDMEAEKYLPFKSFSMKLTQAVEGNNHVAGAISIISEACEQWPCWFAAYRATNQPINQQTQASSPSEGGLDVGLQWVWITTIARGGWGGWFALRISRHLKSQQWPLQNSIIPNPKLKYRGVLHLLFWGNGPKADS